MMLYKTFLSVALIGMAAHVVGAEEDITMYEEESKNSPDTIVGGVVLRRRDASVPFW